MWLYLAVLVGLYFLRRWYRERQTVEKLTDKYVFITGCDSGFGNQLARQLDSRGLRVLAACLTEKGAQELERLTSDRLKTTLLDVTSTESVAAATEWVKTCVGNKGLWGLVNNAGKAIPTAINEWLTKEDFAKVLDVNLLGLIDVTLQMLPLVRRARGRVVNISSVMGRLACFGGGYCPSKYGVEAFSDVLRREISPFGIKVSIVEPGAFSTGILQSTLESFQTSWNKVLSETKEVYGQLYFDKFLKSLQNQMKSSNKNLFLVTDCVEHALTSRYPRARYSGGLDAKLFYLPVSYLPSSVADFIVTYTWPKPAQAVSG
ncbi:17-beta-hydroxysteroid dehydrogenase type 6-like [Ahaetulla prasina]|uniref:17-beta-hydroxysteroid dehydrogenase type 6-like n=1 Tax=Ahaetulla prasina TaxID=499056 RepID=UPI002648B191|nr:17-beta-hydroxysteroid dehydrogenase type 6-like [Ahaetulla prasina]XP_058028656.1 17-beta-hydroxysteroid dehydrogenase type 6-like [Ahaetulla prasina]